MSLNWKEIDQILSELSLTESHIQKIRQPDYHTLIFDIYSPGNRFRLLISMNQGKTRLHRIVKTPSSEIPLQRFAQFLRSRIKGGRIILVRQLGSDRIVQMKILRAGEVTILWIRLWAGPLTSLLPRRTAPSWMPITDGPGGVKFPGGHTIPRTRLENPV